MKSVLSFPYLIELPSAGAGADTGAVLVGKEVAAAAPKLKLPETGAGDGEDPKPAAGAGDGEDPKPAAGAGDGEDPKPAAGAGDDPKPSDVVDPKRGAEKGEAGGVTTAGVALPSAFCELPKENGDAFGGSTDADVGADGDAVVPKENGLVAGASAAAVSSFFGVPKLNGLAAGGASAAAASSFFGVPKLNGLAAPAPAPTLSCDASN